MRLPFKLSESVVRLNPNLFHSAPERLPVPPAEAVPAGSERDLHEEVERLCLEQGWLFVHSRMDRAATIAVGWPDFTVFMPGGNVCFLELKAGKNLPTAAQASTLAQLRGMGFVAITAWSMAEVRLALRAAGGVV